MAAAVDELFSQYCCRSQSVNQALVVPTCSSTPPYFAFRPIITLCFLRWRPARRRNNGSRRWWWHARRTNKTALTTPMNFLDLTTHPGRKHALENV
eukprot:6049258-Pyramimonas_sp.AAC.1